MDFFKTKLEKELFFFSIPLLLSMLTQQLYSAVDTMIVGMNLGINELSAVGNGATIATSFFIISGALEMASDVIISRFYGQKDNKSIARWSVNLLAYTFFCVGIICLIAIFYIDQMIYLLNIDITIASMVKTYSVIYIAGLPLIGLYDVARAIIISLNESKRSFYYVLASSLLNIFLDIIFIRYFHMGVAGAAIATVLSQICLLVVSLSYLYKKLKNYKEFKLIPQFRKDDIQQLLKITLPTAFQQCGVTAVYLFLQAFINPFGTEIVSGYVAMSRVMTLFRQCLVAFSMTASIFAARFLASKDYDSLKETHKFIFKISTLYSILVGLIFIFLSKPICSLFFDVNLYTLGYEFFKTYLICSIFMIFSSGYKFIQEGILRSALKMKEFVYCSIIDMGSRIIVTYLLLYVAGNHAFWLGETIARTLACVLSLYYLINLYKELKII